MRRVFLALSGLVAATTLLISLKSAPGATRLPGQVAADNAAIAALASASATPSPGASGPTPPPGPSVPGPTGGPSHTTAPPKAPVTTTKPPVVAPPNGPAPAAPTFVGDTAVTEFGFVRVAISVANGRMLKVSTVEMPEDEPRSKTLSDAAGPVLCQRAFTAQSANIDSYSGATWTSGAFKQSLRSAMTKAGLA